MRLTTTSIATRAALTALCAAAALLCVTARAADFAPAGAKATLSVEYRYESTGKLGPSRDKSLVSHDWRTRRVVEMSAELVASKPLPFPSLQAADAATLARTQQQGAQAQKASGQMAPMMAGAEAIMARCGDDEKCIEREVMKMGAGMASTPQLDATLKTGRDTAAALQAGGDRYQAWRAVSEMGRYSIEGQSRIVHRDPGCMALPGATCQRDTVSKGTGDVPPVPGRRGGPSAIEVDAQARTITLVLPVPLGLLTYTDVVTSNEPPGTQQVPPGTHARQLKFVTTADGKVAAGQALTVPLKGGWRSQAGEQVVQVKGEGPEGGKLVVSWRFNAP